MNPDTEDLDELLSWVLPFKYEQQYNDKLRTLTAKEIVGTKLTPRGELINSRNLVALGNATAVRNSLPFQMATSILSRAKLIAKGESSFVTKALELRREVIQGMSKLELLFVERL